MPRQEHPVLFTQCLEQSKGGEGGRGPRGGGGREISQYSRASYRPDLVTFPLRCSHRAF